MLLFLLFYLINVFYCSMVIIVHCYLFLMRVLFTSEMEGWLQPYFFIVTKENCFVISDSNLVKEITKLPKSLYSFTYVTVILVQCVLACFHFVLLRSGRYSCGTAVLVLLNVIVLPYMPKIFGCKLFKPIHGYSHTSTVNIT